LAIAIHLRDQHGLSTSKDDVEAAGSLERHARPQ
jgi:hypothetical protein